MVAAEEGIECRKANVEELIFVCRCTVRGGKFAIAPPSVLDPFQSRFDQHPIDREGT